MCAFKKLLRDVALPEVGVGVEKQTKVLISCVSGIVMGVKKS